MRNVSVILAALVLVLGAYFTFDRTVEGKKAEAEALARKAEAALKRSEAELKKSEADARRAKSEEESAKSKALAAEEARKERSAAADEARELAKAKREEAQKAKSEERAAAEKARHSDNELKIAEATKAAAKALAEHAVATNAVRQAELEALAASAALVELELKKTIAASNLVEMQKTDYLAMLKEVEELQELLRRREEETRPNKTLEALIAQNDAAREAELAEMAKKDEKYAEEEARRKRVLREGIPATPQKPLTKTELRIAAAGEALDNIDEMGRERTDKTITEKLEKLMRQAYKQGRIEVAECYLDTLRTLVPGYGKTKQEPAK